MFDIKIFCDGSVNPQEKIGFGAYFILDENSSKEENLKNQINTKKFENTSSTKLELEVLLWALENENLKDKKVLIYTDCQNILSLLDREDKLYKSNFQTKTGKKVKNEELYKKFYEINKKLDCTFLKVKGHKASNKKDEIDRLFNLVDKGSRRALREYLNRK